MGLQNDELLYRNTARLSISTKDGESLIGQVRELLHADMGQRRDSAVSLNSFEEPENDSLGKMAEGPKERAKRRRSSGQALPPVQTKKPKEHKRKKKAMEAPSLVYSDTRPLAFSLIRQLMLEALTDEIEKNIKKTVLISNTRNVNNVVVCFVPGLVKEDFSVLEDKNLLVLALDKKEGVLGFFYQTFDKMCLTMTPGHKDTLFLPLQTLINFPLTKQEKKKRADELRNTKLVLYDLLLTREQMKKNRYPIHSSLKELSDPESDPESDPSESESEWVETRKFDHEGSHTFALDCEFCEAKSGKVLTRISIVNFQNEVVFDSYVKPDEEVTDYLTKYSGITAEIVENATATLKDIQNKIMETVSDTDILIGHSLESDLNVMKVKHPRIIDTALLYEHHRGPPLKPGLKWLSEKHLCRNIQKGEQTGEGHSSVEDLNACLDLVKMKLMEGPDFGKMIRETSIFEKIKDKGADNKKYAIIDYFPESYGVDLGDEEAITRISVTNDDEIVEFAEKAASDSSVMLLRFKELEFNTGRVRVPHKYSGCLHSDLQDGKTEELDEETRNKLLQNLSNRLQNVYDALPRNTCFILCTEAGDTREVSRLQGVRRHFQQLQREGADLTELEELEVWDFDKLSALQREITNAREAIAFFALKEPTSSA